MQALRQLGDRLVDHRLVEQVEALADDTARSGNEAMARQAASALYHLTSAIAMGWEAGRTGSLRRMLLAQLVLCHRLLPQDPLRAPQAVDLAPLFDPAFHTAPAEALQAMALAG